MSLAVLIVDTSYLLELYKVPAFFSPAHHAQVKSRFERAVEAKSRLYVPFPVLFEVANHIVDGRAEGSRVALAKRFVGDVLRSIEKATPFIITPAIDEDGMKALLRVFAEEMARERIGLTDSSIIEAAVRLKQSYGAHARIHIWTKDRRLKAREPDAEPNAFVNE
jgi:predicted nucleic acid-binding protein